MAKTKVKTFKFSEHLLRLLDAMPERRQLRYFKYAAEYGLYGTEPEVPSGEEGVWLLVKSFMLEGSNDKGK